MFLLSSSWWKQRNYRPHQKACPQARLHHPSRPFESGGGINKFYRGCIADNVDDSPASKPWRAEMKGTPLPGPRGVILSCACNRRRWAEHIKRVVAVDVATHVSIRTYMHVIFFSLRLHLFVWWHDYCGGLVEILPRASWFKCHYYIRDETDRGDFMEIFAWIVQLWW